MDRDGQRNAARRIALASALVVALLATAFGVTIWRYQDSHGASSRALSARAGKLRAEHAATTLFASAADEGDGVS